MPEIDAALWKPRKCGDFQAYAVNAKPVDPFGALLPSVAQVDFPALSDHSMTSTLFVDQSSVSVFPLNVIVDADGVIRMVSQAHSIEAMAGTVDSLLEEAGLSASSECPTDP